MKIKKNSFLICLCCLCVTSCSSKQPDSVLKEDVNSTNTSYETSAVESTINEKDQIYTMSDDYYVEYAVPNIISIQASNITAFNEMLNEKGYDFGVKIIGVEYDNYSEELKKYSPDIAFVGFNSDGIDTSAMTIASGYYASLDNYLEESTMYSRISSKLWESVKYNGSIYSIPNCTAQDLPVSIVFDLDKINKGTAERFSGDISEIKDILGTGRLLYQINGYDFSEYYGYDHSKGILISQDKDVELPYDSEECNEWLKTINELYINNQVTDDEKAEWSICITKDVERITKDNIFVYSPKAVITTRYSASTGIVAASDKKDNAFKLLELLHTDNDLANCLIYGTGYAEKDGYAIDQNGEIMDRYIDKLFFGLDESLLWSDDYLLHFSSYKEKITYYDENVIVSPMIGVQLKADVSGIQTILDSNAEIWKAKNLDESLSLLKSAYEKNGIQDIIIEINEKLNGEEHETHDN